MNKRNLVRSCLTLVSAFRPSGSISKTADENTTNSIQVFNTLRPRQDGRHFADDIFTCNFVNENCCILIEFSLKYVRKGPIDNNPSLVRIMAWRRSGDKPLSEPMMISLPTHVCVTRPQWVNVTAGTAPTFSDAGVKDAAGMGDYHQKLAAWLPQKPR